MLINGIPINDAHKFDWCVCQCFEACVPGSLKRITCFDVLARQRSRSLKGISLSCGEKSTDRNINAIARLQRLITLIIETKLDLGTGVVDQGQLCHPRKITKCCSGHAAMPLRGGQ